MKQSTTVFFIFLMNFIGCVQEFDPSSEGFENLLVVESFLSNGSEKFEVKLSRTMPLDTFYFIPETGATVRLTEDGSQDYFLDEHYPGTYQYGGDLNAQAGRLYQLHIVTRDGEEYESEEVMMRPTPGIDSITYKFEDLPQEDITGAQIYIYTHDPNNNTWYYRWEWDETWIVRTPYNSRIYWDNGQIMPRLEDIHTCWKSEKSMSIKIASSRILNEDRINAYPLLFISNQTNRLRTRYSLNVRQFALSSESYNYWKELEKFTENLGTLFDPLPSGIRGNIYNLRNGKEKVLGYFDAAEVKTERIYIVPASLPLLRLPNFFPYCSDTIVPYNMIEQLLPYGYELVAPIMNPAPGYIMTYPECFDCRYYGTTIKPDFWE